MSALGTTPCRALVGGFGRPGMRDLDFGRQVIDCLQQLDWPDGVVVEDLSCSAPLVLHRLQELRPTKLVLVGAVARDLDPPGTLRRYRADLAPPEPGQLHRSVQESVMGIVDLDHTLAMARHWGGLPVDTTVIEVEPAEASFGIGFSEVLATCLDPIIDMVRVELTCVAEPAGRQRDFAPDDVSLFASQPTEAGERVAEPSDELSELRSYAQQHAEARLHTHRGPALVETVPGVALVGTVRPWGVFVDTGGDWFDVIPLDGGAVGIVIGSVAGRGVEAAAAMSDLRAAVRAYAVDDGDAPARLVHRLDRLAAATGLGQQAKLLYLALQPDTGDVTYSSAGSCPPLVLDGGVRGGHYVDTTDDAPLGTMPTTARCEGRLRLTSGSTMLLFTDGLVQSRTVSRTAGMERLRLEATDGAGRLDDVCDHVLTACTRGLRRDDDICLLGIRLLSEAATRREPAQRCRG